MIDVEVERLRRLRGTALQVRAVACALSDKKWARDDGLLRQGRCAAWRVARFVSGRLRAHPNVRYQQGAGVGTLVRNSLVAAASSFAATNRRRALLQYSAQLKSLTRELDDARALTWAAELSDIFGRSLQELRVLIDAVQCEMHASSAPARGARASVNAINAESPFLTI
jgi:hypothetical protein